jgi:hypothetical protein
MFSWKPTMKIQVKIINGPAADQSFVVEENSRCVVGRGKDADFRITDDPLISRAHFAIAFEGKAVTLTDFGSTNGTFVDGEALIADQPVYLRDGQSFVAGRTSEFLVSLVKPSPATINPVPGAQPPTLSPPSRPRSTSPLYDSGEILPPSAVPPISPTPTSDKSAGTFHGGAASGNFSQSVVTEIGRDPRLGAPADLGPTDQSGLLFNNFSTSGSGEFFASAPGSNQTFSSTPPPLDPLDPSSVDREFEEGRAPGGPISTPSRPPIDEAYYGSIAPPGMVPGGSRPEFRPLPPPPAAAPVSSFASAPPSVDRQPGPTDFADFEDGNPNGLDDDDPFGANQSTPVHPRSPQAAVGISGSVGMPGQVHAEPDRGRDSRSAELPAGNETAVTPQGNDFDMVRGENGLFFFNGAKVEDVPRVLAALEVCFESMYCVDFGRAGIDPKAVAVLEVETSRTDDAAESKSSPGNFMAIDDGELDHQSPFEDVAPGDDSVASPFTTPTSDAIGQAHLGTPLFHWFPPAARWLNPLLLSKSEFSYEAIDFWEADALVCLFGSSTKQMIEHAQQLVRTNLKTGKSGNTVFGFCWPSVLTGTLETQSAKVIDRIYAGGVAAILLEDPQQELGWRLASQIDLTKMLRDALGNPQQ